MFFKGGWGKTPRFYYYIVLPISEGGGRSIFSATGEDTSPDPQVPTYDYGSQHIWQPTTL